MTLTRISTALFISTLLLACGDDEDPSLGLDSVENIDDEDDITERALSHKTFYISNPTGKSYRLKVTGSIPSGTGKVYGMHIFSIDSLYSMIDISCGGVSSCSATRNLYGCTNYGTVPVMVDYSGTVSPKLTYWFYDC